MEHSYYRKNKLHKEQIITQTLLNEVEYWLSEPNDRDNLIIIDSYYPTEADKIYLKLYGYNVVLGNYSLNYKIYPICWL